MAIVKHKVDIDKMIEDVKDIAINSTDFYRSTETDIGILAYAVYVLLQQLKGVTMSDLIRREDAMQVAFLYPFFSDALMEEIKAIPSVDIPHSDDWEKYSDRLWKNAYERGKADRPQGEWIDAEIPLESGGSMPIQACNLCKTFYPLAYTGGGHRFCPNCGARMKGVDDE